MPGFGTNINGGFWGAPPPMSYTQYALYVERLLKEFALCYDKNSPAHHHNNQYAAIKSKEISEFVGKYWREEFCRFQAGPGGHVIDRRTFTDDNH